MYNFFVLKKREPAGDVESQLFRLITLPNGTTKNTSANRLDELNLFTLPFLSGIPFPEIKDVAVSSGISTIEWLQQLEENKITAKINATDLYVKAYLILKTSSLAILCDSHFNPLLIEVGRSLFRTSFPKGSFRLNWGKLFSKVIRTCWIRKETRENIQHTGSGQRFIYPIHLLTAGFEQTSALSFSEEDILLPPDLKEIEKYDVIRAANILNKVYFSNANMEKILSNLSCQLKPGGMLIVCKTDNTGRNHASLFLKKENGFSLLKNLNGGSEIENLVLQFNLKK